MPLAADRPFLISPPFGSHFAHRSAYSVLGSYTAEPRHGRWRRVVRTVRPVPSDAGPAWINKIGLRNPGIASLPKAPTVPAPRHDPFAPGTIVSFAPLEPSDWHKFEQYLDESRSQILVEFNISCPNVDEHPSLPPNRQITRLLANCPDAIFKLPPTKLAVDTAARLADLGARYVHLSNTIPSAIGGISGAPLREQNLPLVEAATRARGALVVIAGGGIYEPDHVRQYRDAGATRFSLGTAWFWPPRAKRILRVK